MDLPDAPWPASGLRYLTKYKQPRSLSTDDVAQVTAYAELLDCTEAILIYPAPLDSPLDVEVGRIRVRTLAFDLGGELEQAGRLLVAALPLP